MGPTLHNASAILYLGYIWVTIIVLYVVHIAKTRNILYNGYMLKIAAFPNLFVHDDLSHLTLVGRYVCLDVLDLIRDIYPFELRNMKLFLSLGFLMISFQDYFK